jgi:hypothetical protein
MAGGAGAMRSPGAFFEANGKPVIWSGRGLSWAVSVTAAAECRRLGRPAFAVSIPELLGCRPEGMLVLVTRSGQRPPALVADALVTETGECETGHVIRVSDPGDAGHWLALRSARAALDAVLAALGAPPAPRFDAEPRDAQDRIWIYAAHAEIARAVLRAASHKVPGLGGEAADCDEVGHGLHAQILAGRRVVAVRGAGDDEAWMALERWCCELGVRIETQALPVALGPAAVFGHALAVVEAQAASMGVPPAARPLAAAHDWLREDQAVGGILA